MAHQRSRVQKAARSAPSLSATRPGASGLGPTVISGVSDLLELQRTLGNQAVGRLITGGAGPIARLFIQRKPADIDKSWPLAYDHKGTATFTAAPRHDDLGKTTVINAQLRDGWVVPKDKLIGGHLFKAEYGGPDDDSNVVPWSKASEGAFSAFEKEYEAAVIKDAKINANKNKANKTTNPFSATIKTQATFADRPDLSVTDDELGKAGWPETEPGRAARKSKYTDVAENFSGIPTSVTVTVSGLSVADKVYTANAAKIAPTFTRNDEAIKPGYVVPVRFTRKATADRKFAKVSDWAKAQGRGRSQADEWCIKKLNHVAARHPDHFNVTGNSFKDLRSLETTIDTFIKAADTEQILGMYLGDEVVHYVNHTSRLWVCTEPDGELVAGFKLGDKQYNILVAQGTVG